MFHRRTLIALLLLITSLGHAQDANPSERETIQQLVQQVKELQERVRGLESQQGSSSDSRQHPVSQPAEVSPGGQEEAGSTQPESLPQELHELHGIQWRGFGELDYKVLNQRKPELGAYGFDPGSHGNFYTGDFDLFLSSKINDKASVVSEIAFGETADQNFNVDLERFLLKYDVNDHLKMSLGRYQTGISFYNSAFRTAQWFLTTADRPLITEFAADGGLLPTQAIGVSLTGLVPSGKLGLNYLFEYGSSDTERPDINGSGGVDDEHNGNHINVGLFVRPEAVPGLQIGGSFYHDKISRSALPSSIRIGQTIVNAHVVYIAHGIEILNEGFLIRHVPDNGPAVNMPAFYSQFSKRFGKVRPFVRYQYVNTNKADVVFDDVGLRHGPSFGARYDFNDNIAFKTQLDHTLRKGQPDLDGLHLQLAFTF